MGLIVLVLVLVLGLLGCIKEKEPQERIGPFEVAPKMPTVQDAACPEGCQ